MSEEDLDVRLRKRLDRERDVRVAYLFGSQASGRPGPLSDVDVAVLLDPDADIARRHPELVSAIGDIAGAERADVLVLNDAPVAVAFRVLKEGRLILSRDEKARVRHHARVVDRYIDMAPMRRTLEQGLRHRLAEGRFGRP